MRRLTFAQAAKLRGALFTVCATCTLWLVIQNTILFTLVPWNHLPALPAAPAVRAAVVGVVQLSLVPVAFALGWLASHRVTRTTQHGEGAHE